MFYNYTNYLKHVRDGKVFENYNVKSRILSICIELFQAKQTSVAQRIFVKLSLISCYVFVCTSLSKRWNKKEISTKR